MSADLKNQAINAVALAKKAGADDAWASAGQSRDVEFGYRDGALEKVKDTTSRSLGLQVYANGRYSSHQTTDLNPDRLGSFISEAVAITRALEPDEYREITPEALFANQPTDDLDLVDTTVETLDRDQRLAWCEALDAASTSHERVISATAGVYDGTQQSASASSNGFVGTQQSTYCWFGSSVTLRDQGDRRASDGFYAGGAHVADLPDAGQVGQVALSRALSRLDSEKGPTLKTVMVVDSRAAGQLIGRLMRPANARSVQQGRSFWAPLIGEQAFSNKLTIIDDPLIKRGLASRHYDSEGIAARALPIVENGVVRNIYVDTYYGRKADIAPTTGSASNQRVAPGDKSLEQLLGDVGSGIYVTSWLGGNADATTGDFSLGLRGHIIDNGQVGRPVGEMNVTGNLKDLFAQLEMLGNDPYPYSSTLAPSLVFVDVDFSGA
ncbi:MAG: TldD/PmbA family protein [Woeseiaceae bacterium]|nr:TldD/PmbA family protein [Woeseiaceae bacterium]NIP21728.1 TldD/PmbA family protein [Woeseiaceae bacterium]NIS90813.1 TldD/PmbA family protein [Woeseiaceae bacterium]